MVIVLADGGIIPTSTAIFQSKSAHKMGRPPYLRAFLSPASRGTSRAGFRLKKPAGTNLNPA